MSTVHPLSTQVAARTALAVAGGYLFVRHLITAGIALLMVAGADYETAGMLAMMLAFLVYLVMFLWAFAARRLWHPALVLLGGAALLACITYWLVPRLAAVH